MTVSKGLGGVRRETGGGGVRPSGELEASDGRFKGLRGT